MKITFRLPSKATTYGYAEVELDLPDGTDPQWVGSMYAGWVGGFLIGEQAGFRAFAESKGIAVEARNGTYEPPFPAVEMEVPLASKEPATRPANGSEGQAHAEAVSLIEETMGATVVDQVDTPPWEAPPPAAKAKPWENGGAAIKPAAINW